MTNNRSTVSSNTLDISIDKIIHRNDIKNHNNLQFKTIHNHKVVDHLLASSNAQHLHQAHGTPFTIKSLRTLIGKDIFTPFSQEILDGTTRFDNLNVSKNIKQCLRNLKRKNIKGKINNKGIIPLKEFKQGYKQWKERTIISPS